MRVAVFGASGMVGQGVLRECLLAPDVERVTVVVRRSLGRSDPKLEEIVAPDLTALDPYASRLLGLDAAFFPLGTSSVGKTEAEFSRVTYDLTLSIAGTIARLNPGTTTFVYVSGAGTDSTGTGPRMWARVKGRTENALTRLAFRQVYLFRPGIIQARHGARSRTLAYRIGYIVLWPFVGLMVRLGVATTTDRVGRAMLRLVREQPSTRILGTREINELGR